LGRKRWAKPDDRLPLDPLARHSMKAPPSPLSSRPERSGVEGSAVQRTSRGNVLLPPKNPIENAIAAPGGNDGCPRFAPAYLGRKRWAKPDDRFPLDPL